MAISVKVTTISPHAAEKLLANNVHNRPLKTSLVNRLTKIIDENRWVLNGDTIVVDTKQRLLDGQHRLHAVIRARQPIRTILVTGVDPEVFHTIDQGVKRNSADIFHVCGVKNATTVGAAVRIFWQVKKCKPNRIGASQPTPEMDERVALFDENPWIEDAVAQVVRQRQHLKGFPLTMFAGLFCAFREYNESAADAFLYHCVTGKVRGNPACTLKQKMLWLMEQDYTISAQAKCALIRVAWNHFAEGKPLSTLEVPANLDFPFVTSVSKRWCSIGD